MGNPNVTHYVIKKQKKAGKKFSDIGWEEEEDPRRWEGSKGAAGSEHNQGASCKCHKGVHFLN